jgi:Cu/Ag efflux pump CusA
MMLAGQNSREVAERVKARIAEIQTKLPDGVEIQIQYDRSQLIDRTILKGVAPDRASRFWSLYGFVP